MHHENTSEYLTSQGLSPNFVSRFSLKINKTEQCWIWTGARSVGYGSINTGMGQTIMAHRASWLVHCGPIPNGLMVLHSCDIRLCVNPDHLFLGTAKDNCWDMIRKGRSNMFAIRDPKHRLNWEKAESIRTLFAHGVTQRAIAKLFRVTEVSVRNVIHKRSWAYPHTY